MDYKFNKVSLEQAPDIAVDLVTDAVCGYLKKINNVDTLKGLSYGMDAYDHGEGRKMQLICHINGSGKKYKHTIFIMKHGIYIYHIKGNVSNIERNSDFDDPNPEFGTPFLKQVGKDAPDADGHGNAWRIKPVEPDYVYPVKDTQKQNALMDLRLHPFMTDAMKQFVEGCHVEDRYQSASTYIIFKAARKVNAQVC